jgi:hypothetical protein
VKQYFEKKLKIPFFHFVVVQTHGIFWGYGPLTLQVYGLGDLYGVVWVQGMHFCGFQVHLK